MKAWWEKHFKGDLKYFSTYIIWDTHSSANAPESFWTQNKILIPYMQDNTEVG
jgi:hypothetical protein